MNYTSAFVHDDVKVNRRLTLTLGLRYENSPPWHEKAGRIERFTLQDYENNVRSTVFPHTASRSAATTRSCNPTLESPHPVRFIRALLVAIAIAVSLSAQGTAVTTVFIGARLIDGTGAPPIDDSIVVVEADRIRAAGPRARVSIPRSATLFDAKGKVLLPGLVDVHCHINQPA